MISQHSLHAMAHQDAEPLPFQPAPPRSRDDLERLCRNAIRRQICPPVCGFSEQWRELLAAEQVSAQ